jgi:hypothetical protein
VNAADVPAAGRVCTEPGCSTILSTYNKSMVCALHSVPEYRHALYNEGVKSARGGLR